MIKLKPKRVDRENNNAPILYDREIDEFAHAVLKDYKPNLLKEPGAVRFEHFLEAYLGATLMYHDIYNDDPKHRILGATAFREGYLKVFDRDNARISRIPVEANTVVIDNFVMESGKEGLASFTGLHEGGHILMHSYMYNEERIPPKRMMPTVVCCRRGSIENFGVRYGKRTPSEWLEHQADYFAAAFAMPNVTFKPFVHQLLREHSVWKGDITLRQDMDLDILAEEILPECIAEVYGVSKRAAFIKMVKSEFVIDSRVRNKNAK